MDIKLITIEDLRDLKKELLEDLQKIILNNVNHKKVWLRSSEVKDILKISSGTLQKLRINGVLLPTKVGGTFYYNYMDIENLLITSAKI